MGMTLKELLTKEMCIRDRQGPQLGLEEIPAGQADADGAVAQRGVVLVVELHVVHGLVRADITLSLIHI